MSIKLVVSGFDVAEKLELGLDEDVLRCILSTIQYRQENRKELKSADSEVSYWLESGRQTLRDALCHQINSRNAQREILAMEAYAS